MSQQTPEGWVRTDLLAGMDTVARDGYVGMGGGYKCGPCDHFVPIEAIEDDVCPVCERGGMIGTIIQGTQEVTSLRPAGWFDDE